MATKYGLGKGLGALIPETLPLVEESAASTPPAEPASVRRTATGRQTAGHSKKRASGQYEAEAAAAQAAPEAQEVVPAASAVPAGEAVPAVAEAPAAAPAFILPGGEEVAILPLAQVSPDPSQPRKDFPEASIEELADSIRRHGLIQPIIVDMIPAGKADEDQGSEGMGGIGAPDPAGGMAQARYSIVAGERRYRAALRAGLTEVPAIVRRLSKERRLEISLIENIQREDLNPVDEAEAYRRLMELTGYTQDQVAEAVGKSRPAIANAVRLLRLSGPMLEALRSGSITAGHARALLVLPEGPARESLFARIGEEALSVRQAEDLAAGRSRSPKHSRSAPKSEAAESPGGALGEPDGGESARATAKTPVSGTRSVRDPDLVAMEQRLIHRLGTKVLIKGDAGKGCIEVEYYSLEDFERILAVIGG